MASLSGGLTLGTTSASSLVKSAATLENELNTYQDDIQAQQYAVSGHTDDALETYQQYLQGRITTLSSTGSITDATKAVTLTNTLTSAVNSNITAGIQRENIQVMAGNATPTDKLDLIQQEFTRAVGIGDMTTAQSLESQAYSLSQTIQEQAQTAATAANTLTAAGASQENNVADQLTDKLKQLNVDAGAAGGSNLNTQLKSWVTANKSQLLALATGPGVTQDQVNAIDKAVNSSQPSYQDIVAGVGQAIISAHYQAYLSELPVDPETAQNYLDSATNIANGSTKLDTLAGSLSMSDIQNWQANPSMFAPHENANTGQLEFTYDASGKMAGTTAINGFKFDSQGNVTAAFTGSDVGQTLTKQQATQTSAALNKLGFNFSGQNLTDATSMTNGITVQATDKIPKFLQPILAGQQNVTLQAYVTPQGIQLATINAQGKDNIYLVAQDSTGKQAVYKATGQYANGNPIFGKQTAAGDYGFNQNNNTLWKSSTSGNAANSNNGGLTTAEKGVTDQSSFGLSNLKNDITGFLGLGRSSLNDLVNTAQQKAAQITAQRQAAEAALKVSQPIQLTNPSLKGITLNPINPAATPTIQPAASPQVTTSPQPKTVNPQKTTTPQGNNANPQQGGQAVATLTETSGQGIKL